MKFLEGNQSNLSTYEFKNKEFLKFEQSTFKFPDQVIRYYYDDNEKPINLIHQESPLFVSSINRKIIEDKKTCSICDSDLILEFQVF